MIDLKLSIKYIHNGFSLVDFLDLIEQKNESVTFSHYLELTCLVYYPFLVTFWWFFNFLAHSRFFFKRFMLLYYYYWFAS